MATANLRGKVAVITGASSGIGAATALELSKAGASVALCDIKPCEGVLEAIQRQKAAEKDVPAATECYFYFDARCKKSIEKIANNILDKFNGQCDILINNAGVGGFYPLDGDDEEFEEMWRFNFDVNVDSQQRLSRALLPALKKNACGRIINIASTEGIGATIFNSCYAASKHASIGLTKALAVELGSQGVTVNAVCPGPTRTQMVESIPEKQKQYFAKRLVPLRRYGEPYEIAYVILCLVDDRASFVNGAVIRVDGGILSNAALLPWKMPWKEASSVPTSKL